MRKLFFCLIAMLAIGAPSARSENSSTLGSFFSEETATTRLQQMEEALTDFRGFTEVLQTNSNLESAYGISPLYSKKIPDAAKVKISVKGADINRFSNIDWDMQNIGFTNWGKYVEGYMAYQRLTLLKKDYELMALKKAPSADLEKLQYQIEILEKQLVKTYLQENSFAD